jgi:Fic family protein
MTKEENIFWAKRNLVDYIWKSANLEGIGVTYPDTQAIYNGMSVAGYSIEDINAVNDLKHAWHFLLDTIDEPLHVKYIKDVHRLLGKFTVINSGSFRLEDVRIGGTDWIPEMPSEEKTENELIKILNGNDSALDIALDITLYLMRAQLFYDGNKRLAMLIGNKWMIQNGQGILSVKQKDTGEFYKLLVEYYESGKGDLLKQFLYESCIDGMNFSG